jgi:hypothetical protein
MGNDLLGQEKRQCSLPARDLVEGPHHFTSLAYGYGSALKLPAQAAVPPTVRRTAVAPGEDLFL